MRIRKFLLIAILLHSLLLVSNNLLAQDRKITGLVTDQNNLPLANVTVSAKGTATVALTDLHGNYAISINSAVNTLVFSYVGAKSVETKIDNRNVIDMTLTVLGNNMDEVVVVGYGTSRRSDLTTSQVTVSAEAIEKTINTTFEQALQGRAPGVYTVQNSGQPGGGVSVNIRGINSLGATQPLYVIDGVQFQSNEDVSFGNSSSTNNALSGLNPSDIQDIQILQGPSAAAIYGARATNGVVIITTKRGRAGEIKIDYGYQYSLQAPPKSLPVMNLRQYAQMVNEYHELAGGTTPGQMLDPSLLGEGTNWQKELFNKAALNKHQLSLNGGGNNTTYYFSGEYLDQNGVAAGSGFKRYGFRLNLDNKPREWVKINMNLNYNQTNENLTTTNYGDAASPLIANALRLTPQIPVTNLDGSWGGSDPVNGANQYAPVNPIALASLITNNNMKRQFVGGINLDFKLFKGLSFRTSLNGNAGNGLSTYYVPTYKLDAWHYNTVSSLQSGSHSSWYWNWNQLLEYSRNIGRHQFTVMASHEAQESLWKALTAGRTGFLTNDILDVNAGDPLTATNSGGTYPWAMESYLGRLSYNFDNRYLLTATFRRDGSPYFGEQKRWGNFPSVSVAWRINKEKFFNVSFISDLKLRFETGLTGNQGTGSGIYAPMSNGATTWGSGFLPSTFTNPALQWEETKPYNFGANIGLFNNRVVIDADYYIKHTNNLIIPASLPWYMGTNASPGGLSAPLVNAGSIETKGWNLNINTVNINRNEFKWESNLNLTSFRSILTDVNSDNGFFDRISWWMNNWTQRAAVGKQPWLFRGYIADGLFQSVDEINSSPVPVDNKGDRRPTHEKTGIWLGDVKYKDINGDGIINTDDVTDIGNPWPKLSGGFTNNFSYKNFDLSVLIIGVYGNDIYNYIRATSSNPNNVNVSRNMLASSLNYAKVITDANGNTMISNPETLIPRITNNPVSRDNNYSVNSSSYVEDGSFLRIKNISLSYNFSEKLIRYTKILRGLKATVGVQNILTLTKYSGYDPEIGAYTGTGSSASNQAVGIDFGRYPLTQMYNAAISVNF